ncbi:hypothetical protein O9929_05770 [Vibrio lentus]|nr:hypothetical protein [Vibrio lentus]
MLAQADQNGCRVLSGMILQSEAAFQSADAISEKADQIWRVMTRCNRNAA